jgi:peptide/nickel transport system permease protein
MLFIGRRLLTLIPVFIAISMVSFFVLDYLPGNAARHLLGVDATPEAIANMEEAMGLDRSPLNRYASWASGFLVGDWGTSIASGQSVRNMVGDRFLVTLELALLAIALSLGLAVAMAGLAAIHPWGPFDKGVLVAGMVLLSTPTYVLALLLVLVFSVSFNFFPSMGFIPLSENLVGNLHTLMLPAAAIALPLTGLYCTFLRDDLVEQMVGEEYILTAKSKGLASWRLVFRHALRNSATGLLTLVGSHFGTLVGGTVLVELIFGLPGLGQLLIQATSIRDTNVVLAIVFLLTVVTVLANLVAEIMCSLLDPRISAAGSEA